MSDAPPPSIARRFAFSVAANAARAVLSLVSGLLVARGLGPVEYGNLSYLLGSFLALRALLDMGASSAFYTFISGDRRAPAYYLANFVWLGLQFVISVALVAVVLPSSLTDRLWLGQDRDIVLLALLASFLQNQVWLTIVQLYEADRRTFAVQGSGVLVVVAHIAIVALLLLSGRLTTMTVLWAIVAEYVVVTVWAARALKWKQAPATHADARADGASAAAAAVPSMRAVLSDYVAYCRPMLVVAVLSFAYTMADRWLLQSFGGPAQQGFYQVASQLSIVSLLATTSILNILWKEVAEANAAGAHRRAFDLYERATRQLMLLAGVVSSLLAPWSREITVLLLGGTYEPAWPVLLVMLLYPIHQTMGQINAIMFMASGATRQYMLVTVAGMLISIPGSYLAMAPDRGDLLLPGLGLGALGLGLKTVLLNVVMVNIQAWLIARRHDAAFYWVGQVTSIGLLLGLGFASAAAGREMLSLLHAAGVTDTVALLAGLAVGTSVYFVALGMLLLQVPHWLGLSHHDLGVARRALMGRWASSAAG